MSKRYILVEHHDRRNVPRCNLPGSPFASRNQALKAAEKLTVPTSIKSVKRRTA